ncbi:MAG: pyridoxal 5'-phosphate synthase glutaminase subunit PdxT [Eubacteriales bacterium]|nr:pyridoxal 5'-phosphate synthase glutaminase subunit PdxT [Eubacteriales bacterium]
MKIGVLAVQGAFIEHERIIKALGADCVEIRQKADLEGIDGIILPGGESTVQGKLLRKLDMLDTLKEMIANGLPTLATCAGFILLSEKIENDDTVHIGTMPVTIKRNAYGRQISSFTTTGSLTGLNDIPMVFIRAPFVENVEDGVEVLSEIDGHIVAAQYKNQIGLSFHPELTKDYRIHQMFIDLVKQQKRHAA